MGFGIEGLCRWEEMEGGRLEWKQGSAEGHYLKAELREGGGGCEFVRRLFGTPGTMVFVRAEAIVNPRLQVCRLRLGRVSFLNAKKTFVFPRAQFRF